MAMPIDHQEKKRLVQQQGQHMCRICKKGFASGRALGGHMRVHAINDEPIPNPNKDPPTAGSKWDSAAGERMYIISIDPNRKRSSRICVNCGKEFHSLKLFLKHGCCSSILATVDRDDDDLDGLSSPSSPSYRHKGKRTRHVEKPNGSSPSPHCVPEEEDLANCLVMLSAARVEPVLFIADAEEPSTSASKEVNNGILPPSPPHLKPPVSILTPPISQMFECKGCKKVFVSHQALGGHRASHKKVKGCFAARLESEAPDADNQIMPSPENMPLAIVPLAKKSPQRLPANKSKFHECSVCQRLFPTGQALGGHKRCHWITSKTSKSGAAAVEPMTVASTTLQVGGNSSGENVMLPQMFNHSDHTLDLNKQAQEDDLTGIPLLLDVPAVIYLQSGWSVENKTKEEDKRRNTSDYNNVNEKASNENLDDEAQSKEVKEDELSHLKDMDEGEESSTWLQIGIGSTTNEGSSVDPMNGSNL